MDERGEGRHRYEPPPGSCPGLWDLCDFTIKGSISTTVGVSLGCPRGEGGGGGVGWAWAEGKSGEGEGAEVEVAEVEVGMEDDGE